jgi:CRP/FNR family transcriptional regulator
MSNVNRNRGADRTICTRCDMRVFCCPSGRHPESLPVAAVFRNRRMTQRGEYVFRTGEPCDALCAICAGSTRSSMLTADGGAQVTGFHFSGDLIGADALGAHTHRCDVVAQEPTVVCEISFQRLNELADRAPQVQHLLVQLLCDQFAHSQDVLHAFLGKKNAGARLAAFFAAVARRLEQRGLSPSGTRLHLSRADLGNYLGLSKETVSRLIARFARDRLLRCESRSIRLTDAAHLADLVSRIEPAS